MPNLFRVPTKGIGKEGEQIFDVFGPEGHIADPNDPQLQGIDINALPFGTAPSDFESKFGIQPGFQEPKTPAEKLKDQGAVTTGGLPEDNQKKQEDAARRKRILDFQEQLFASLTPSPEEQKLQADLAAKRQEGTGAFVGAQEDIAGIEGRPSTMGFITGATAQRQKQFELQKMRIALEMQPLVDRLNTLSQERGNVKEKAKLALELQQSTMPEVLKTEINEETGEIISVERDPFTGETTSKVVGNITPKPKGTKYVSTSQEVASDGSKIFTGITEDGTVVREVIAPAGTFRVPGTETPEKNVFVETKKSLQQYKDEGFDRAEVELEWRTQNAASGQDPKDVILPLTVQKALDELYPETQEDTEAKWYNPLTWW